ncbi:MAG: RNA methyltransferase, partial [Clostridia bacterium]|nr:RNA methyltransferase [Clostridia bacterium]
VPKRRSAGLNAACAKAAAGALEYMPIAKVSNLQACIEELKEKGIFIFAADMGGKAMYDLDFTVPAAIVIGSEGEGISRMVREKSDHIVSIPQKGRIQSLNASNAAAVLLYEALRQRRI